MKSFYQILLALASLRAVSADLDVDSWDIPAACGSVCRPTVELSGICDVDGGLVGGKSAEYVAEQACYCQNGSFDVGRFTGLCQSCVQQNAYDPYAASRG